MGGTAYMTKADKSDYLALLLAQWQSGPIPDAPDVLASILGGQPSDAVRVKFEAVAGKLTNIRLEQEREWSTTKSDASKKRKERFKERVRNAFGTRSCPVPERFASDSDSLLPLGNRKGTGETHEANQGAKEPRKAKTRTKTYPPDFETFWTAYPCKVGKDKALDSWTKATHKPDVSAIVAKVQAYAQTAQWTRDGGQYIPHPATWLNQGRWADEVTTNTTELAF
jgi:hypothetical protein